MASENIPTGVITLDTERELSFTLGSMKRIEREVPGGIATLGDDAAMIEHLGAVVWSMLPRAAREELTIEDVEDLIGPGNAEAVGDAVAQVIEASVPKGAEGNAPKKGKKAKAA